MEHPGVDPERNKVTLKVTVDAFMEVRFRSLPANHYDVTTCFAADWT
jgi:hypothetical protein